MVGNGCVLVRFSNAASVDQKHRISCKKCGTWSCNAWPIYSEMLFVRQFFFLLNFFLLLVFASINFVGHFDVVGCISCFSLGQGSSVRAPPCDRLNPRKEQVWCIMQCLSKRLNLVSKVWLIGSDPDWSNSAPASSVMWYRSTLTRHWRDKRDWCRELHSLSEFVDCSDYGVFSVNQSSHLLLKIAEYFHFMNWGYFYLGECVHFSGCWASNRGKTLHTQKCIAILKKSLDLSPTLQPPPSPHFAFNFNKSHFSASSTNPATLSKSPSKTTYEMISSRMCGNVTPSTISLNCATLKCVASTRESVAIQL